MSLVFSYTATYPDEVPLMKVRSIRGATKEDVSELQTKLETEAAENLGLAMMYTLAQSANEWLQDRYAAGTETPGEVDEDGLTKEEKAAIKRAEERRKYGTPVTKENFQEWFEEFCARRALEKAKLAKTVSSTSIAAGKKTGRQFFEQRADDEVTALEREADEFDDTLLDDLDEDLLDDLVEEEDGESEE